jgi:hypothetical protein
MFELDVVVLCLATEFGWMEILQPPPVATVIGISCLSLVSREKSWPSTYTYFAIKDLLIRKEQHSD